MNERKFVDWLRAMQNSSPDLLVGPGDDAAVWRTSPEILVTTDMLLDGCEFVLSEAGAYRVGRKAMAVNLSDIAAMAGRPRAALVSVGLPNDCDEKIPCDLYHGLRDTADTFDTIIIGGDTNSWNGPLVISITLLGEPTESGPVLRSGAVPGDWLLVTGELGGSIQGKHLDFTPRVREALEMHRSAKLHAMMDVSDGFSLDLWRICCESGCGAVVRAGALPLSEASKTMNDSLSPLEHALCDGEDFELLIAASPEEAQNLLARQPFVGTALTHVGEFVERGLWLSTEDTTRELEPKGWVHGESQRG